MSNSDDTAPKVFKGVMVSSTFTDLEAHRAALMDALRKQGLFAIAMEDYVTSPDADVISSSLGQLDLRYDWSLIQARHRIQQGGFTSCAPPA